MEAKVNFADDNILLENTGQSVSQTASESEPVACQNGVCELTWKPGRPKAA